MTKAIPSQKDIVSIKKWKRERKNIFHCKPELENSPVAEPGWEKKLIIIRIVPSVIVFGAVPLIEQSPNIHPRKILPYRALRIPAWEAHHHPHPRLCHLRSLLSSANQKFRFKGTTFASLQQSAPAGPKMPPHELCMGVEKKFCSSFLFAFSRPCEFVPILPQSQLPHEEYVATSLTIVWRGKTELIKLPWHWAPLPLPALSELPDTEKSGETRGGIQPARMGGIKTSKYKICFSFFIWIHVLV